MDNNDSQIIPLLKNPQNTSDQGIKNTPDNLDYKSDDPKSDTELKKKHRSPRKSRPREYLSPSSNFNLDYLQALIK